MNGLSHPKPDPRPAAKRRHWTAARGLLVGALGLALLVGPLAAQEGEAERSSQVPRGLSAERPLSELLLRRWGTDQGLPSNTLSGLLFSSAGELWITSFNGLARFDGSTFEIFDKDQIPGLETNGFYTVVEAPDRQTLWLGTQGGGVWTLRGRHFERFAPNQLQGTVGTLAFDNAQMLWISVNGRAVSRLDGETLSWVDLPELRDVIVPAIAEGPPGVLWLGTDKGGVVRLEGDSVGSFTTEQGLPSNAINTLEAEGEVLWVGTQNGLAKIVDGQVTRVEDLGPIGVNRLRRDDYDNLWIASEQGLFRRNGLDGRLEQLRTVAEEPTGPISDLAFDQEGSLWFSTSGRGLYQLREGKITSLGRRSGLEAERVNIVYEASPGRLLLGLDHGAIHRIDAEGVHPFPLDPPLPDVRVRDFLVDRSGTRWIASYAGLLRLDPGGGQRLLTTADGLPANQVRVLLEDRLGSLWVGTGNGGLVKFDGGTLVQVLDMSSGLLSNFVFSLEETPAGDLLVGTHEGLNILHPEGGLTTYLSRRDLPGSLVFNTLAEDDGTLWISTNGGLARLRDRQIEVLGEDEGLPTESIFDLVFDTHGNAWLSSALGLIRLPRAQLDATLDGTRQRVEAQVYDDREGLANRECTGATRMLLASDGRLWIPTLAGVSTLDPAHLPTNPVPPPVRVHRIEVDGRALDFDPGERLEVPPKGRRFVFGFSALSLLVPSKVTVKYQLEGLDQDWVEAGADRTATYTSLPPGDYTFRVIAANNDGVWNDEGASVGFRVVPEIHQTLWFRLLAGVAILLLGLALYRWRVKLVERRSQGLERIISDLKTTEEERQRLIDELEVRNEEMERFIYTVSHDLKSPLLTIRGFLGLVERDAVKGRIDRLAGNIERIDGAAVRMAQLLDELLELSRIGRRRNPPEPCDLGELAREALTLVSTRVEERGLEVEIADDLPTVVGDRARLREIFQNLIDNAAKFMGEQSEPRVWITGREEGKGVRVEVRDNGIGIAPKFHEKVLGLFDRLDPKTEGTGVGLAIVKRIIEVHGGTIQVDSEGIPGEGTTFSFTLIGPPSDGTDGTGLPLRA